MGKMKKWAAAALVMAGGGLWHASASAADGGHAVSESQPESGPPKGRPDHGGGHGAERAPDQEWLVETALRHYANPLKRLELEMEKETPPYVTYTVKEGETLSEIASQFSIPLQEIAGRNNIKNIHRIRAGSQLTIRLKEVKYVVRHGDTLEAIAKNHGVTLDALLASNAAVTRHNQTVFPGQTIYIPTVPPPPKPDPKPRLEKPARTVVLASRSAAPKTSQAGGTAPKEAALENGPFSWPLKGKITSSFGMRWGRMHNGVDIAASRPRAAVGAACSGTVREAGYRNGYGYTVVIDHGQGLKTFYAHLSKIAVKPGQKVARGETVGYQGRSGNATGYHLHFEIRRRNQPVNPLDYLP